MSGQRVVDVLNCLTITDALANSVQVGNGFEFTSDAV